LILPQLSPLHQYMMRTINFLRCRWRCGCEIEFSPSIPTDVHTHDSDSSDAKCESGVEFIVITFSYPLSSQPLEFLTMIYPVVSGFSSFSGSLEMCPESSIQLSEFVAYPTRHLICLIFSPLEVIPRVYYIAFACCIWWYH